MIRRYRFNMSTPHSRSVMLPIPGHFSNALWAGSPDWLIVVFGLIIGFQVVLGTSPAVAAERPKIFVGYIDKDPAQPPSIIVSILDNLRPQLGGLAPETVARLPADWSLPKKWHELGDKGFTHFIVGGTDAVIELQNRYKQPSWIVGKIVRDQGAIPHLTYYGLLFLPIWTSKDDADVYKYVCEDQRTPIVNGSIDCMIPLLALNAASLLRDKFYFIFPELRERYVFLLRCVQAPAADSELALSITQRLWDGLSGFVEPSADWWNDVDMLKKACQDFTSTAAIKPAEFEIRGYFINHAKKDLNLNIVNKVWDRRDEERYKWALGDDLTSEEAHKWREQLEPWRRKNVKCSVEEANPDWDDLMQHLAPHIGSVILSGAAAEPTPWSCDP